MGTINIAAPSSQEATAGLLRRVGAGLRRCLEAERDRWALWLPVALGAGIALYFELPVEPPLWVGVAVVSAGLLLLGLGAAGLPVRPLAIAVIAVGAGFGTVTWRSGQVAAPVLARAYGPAVVEGRVVEVTLLPEGRRLVLDKVVLRGLQPEATPARVRVSLRRGVGDRLATGDRISVVASLAPPPGPAAPGAFDFQRFAWFARLGAVGYATGAPSVITAGQPSGIVMWIDELRRRLSARLVAALPGDAGALAAALIAGDQSGISKDAMQAMRDSGLAHLLSISGLHISFAALLVMGLVRYGLAAIPPLALRFPIKKWAAVAGVLSALFYTLLAGAPVPAQRSFLMLAIVLLAILTDRTALTMRLVCWAAIVILLVLPESLVGASFQLSFAAVIALVAAWEAWRPWQARRADQAPTVSRRIIAHVAASLFTTLVASIATAGFSAYHFNRLSLVGVFANLLAVPLTGIWVMPWGLVALLLLPFGGEAFALVPMGWGIEAIIWVAREAASVARRRDGHASATGDLAVAADPGRAVAVSMAHALALVGRGTSSGCAAPGAAAASSGHPGQRRRSPGRCPHGRRRHAAVFWAHRTVHRRQLGPTGRHRAGRPVADRHRKCGWPFALRCAWLCLSARRWAHRHRQQGRCPGR